MVVVLQDYPSPEISEPIYRMGEKLRVVAQYDYVFAFLIKSNTVFPEPVTHLVDGYEEIKSDKNRKDNL